jgi:hypothetical protein
MKMADTDALFARSLNAAAAVTLSVDKNTSEMLTGLIPLSRLVLNVEKKQCFAQIDSGHVLLLVKDGTVLVIIRCRLQLVQYQSSLSLHYHESRSSTISSSLRRWTTVG